MRIGVVREIKQAERRVALTAAGSVTKTWSSWDRGVPNARRLS
jgi:alanine dehydrogenase